MLFDDVGRLRPLAGERVYSKQDRGYFDLRQPELNWAAIEARMQRLFTGASAEQLSFSMVRHRLESCRQKVLSGPESAGLFDGVHVPFALPALINSDLGRELEDVFIPAACGSFLADYAKYSASNLCMGTLPGAVKIVPNTRWDRIQQARAQGTVVGWYFPLALKGFAIPDQRTLISRLPEAMILSGPLEIAASLVACPELLMRQDDKYPNLLAMSAIEPVDADQAHMFWFFEAYGWNLCFNRRSMIGPVSEYFSGGITLLA
jgi:hypothetical protein